MTDYTAEQYQAAIETAKNQLASITAENSKLKEEVEKLKAFNCEMSKSNEILRTANQSLQEYISTHQTTESAESAPERVCGECDGDCDNCEFDDEEDVDAEGNIIFAADPEDVTADAIDHLIRTNLNLEGKMQGYEDALHILCAWLKYNSAEDEKPQKGQKA